ncbi:MAG: hypothetical protein KY464_03565 [Gemmatimonadetes bacterium]|nr:hypothetical protein [Gemmatimonadota bacterium]
MGKHETAITTTKGNRRLLDPEDHERLKDYIWYEYPNARAYRREGDRIFLLHREVMQVDQSNLRVIFVNEDPRDCRRGNLRVEKRHQRGRQRRIAAWRGSSRFRGVGWHKRSERWQAFIKNPETRRLEHLGFFEGTPAGELRAAQRYDERARQLYGEEAILNFARERKRRRNAAAA